MVYCAATGSQYQVYMKLCLPLAAPALCTVLHTKKAPMKRCALLGLLAGRGAALRAHMFFPSLY
jgi:hypothetical protein